MFRSLPTFGGDPRAVAEIVRGIMDGKTNNTGTITLATGGATSTTLTDRRIAQTALLCCFHHLLLLLLIQRLMVRFRTLQTRQ